MKKFHVTTLGCRTNQYESQGFSDQLLQLGLEGSSQDADVCIVNTCTVTEGADRSSRQQVRSLLKKHPNARIVVTGCMAERAPQELRSLSDRVEIVPNAQKEQLVQEIFPGLEHYPEFAIRQFEAHTRAFVKVQDGCNSFCTYCIIPYVRGRSRSRQIPEILKEVEGLVANGYQEIVLTGINVGDFDGGGTLADLVRSVDAVDGVQRLRISSIDPDEVDAKLAEAVLEGKHTCPSMHIVLQSGSNAILQKMRRKYTRQIFLETVRKMQKRCPDFTVTTDVIVGFPGETEQDFRETLEVLEEIGFAKVHMFPYSARKRTRAALYPHQVPSAEIQKRASTLLRCAEKSAFRLREGFLGRKMEVLLEGQEESGFLSGYTSNFLRVLVPSGDYKPNQRVTVELLENRPDGFWGRVV